jgi:hypothetical protein
MQSKRGDDMKKQDSDYVRGVKAAASLAAEYRTTHPYRLDDCIECKLNVSSRKRPRRNREQLDLPEDSWTSGYALALAEVHRIGHHTAAVLEAAKGAGLTLSSMRKAGVMPFDWQELKRAGVPCGDVRRKT